MTLRTLTAFALASLMVAPAASYAQTTVIDEGTFRLSVRGTPVGTETFSIQRSGTGESAAVVARGRVTLDSGDQVRAALQVAGPDLRPSAYMIEVTGPDAESYRGQAAGNRFRATIRTPAGEMMREYLASEGAVVIDEGVAHQYYFLADRIRGDATIALIIPRQSRQVSARVTDAGTEAVEIDGRQVQARRINVQPTGEADRSVWVDSQGRVLRVSIPDQGFLAQRTDLPG